MANKSNKTMKKFIVLSANVFKDLIENGTIRFESAQIDVQRIQQPTSSQVLQAGQLPAAADSPPAKSRPQGRPQKPQKTSDKIQYNTMHHCQQCEESFPFFGELKKHYISKHPGVPVQDRFSCTECQYTTNLRCSIRSHVLQHKKEQPFGCPYCPSRFTRVNSRNIHVDSIHPGLEHKCTHCHYTTTEYTNLNHHIRTSHDTPLPFPCARCERRFGTQADLDYHAETHVRPFPCSRPRCLRRFTSEAAARQHEAVAHADTHFYGKRPRAKYDMPSLD